MKKKFAYLDKGGILHITKAEETAKQYSASGKVVETEIEAENGYPVVDGDIVIVYAADVMKRDAKGNKIDVIPELAKLYAECE